MPKAYVLTGPRTMEQRDYTLAPRAAGVARERERIITAPN